MAREPEAALKGMLAALPQELVEDLKILAVAEMLIPSTANCLLYGTLPELHPPNSLPMETLRLTSEQTGWFHPTKNRWYDFEDWIFHVSIAKGPRRMLLRELGREGFLRVARILLEIWQEDLIKEALTPSLDESDTPYQRLEIAVRYLEEERGSYEDLINLFV